MIKENLDLVIDIIKQFFKELFCFHRWKFKENISENESGVIYHVYECVKCGDERIEMIKYNPHIVFADDDEDDEYDEDKTFSSRELSLIYQKYNNWMYR